MATINIKESDIPKISITIPLEEYNNLCRLAKIGARLNHWWEMWDGEECITINHIAEIIRGIERE